MKNALGLFALVMVLVMVGIGTGARADTATIVVGPGDNWVAPPLVPFNPDPASVFAASIGDCTLTRFEVPTQEEVSYGSEGFGNILLGDGYKVFNPTSTTFVNSYEGVPDGVPDAQGNMTDMWLSLPGDQSDGQDSGGMHWVGHPFYHDTFFDAVMVTDGTQTKTIGEAVGANWIEGLWDFLDSETQTVRTVGLSSLGADDTLLRATHMYEVVTHRDNLALIVPADLVPEPTSVLVILCGLGALVARRRK